MRRTELNSLKEALDLCGGGDGLAAEPGKVGGKIVGRREYAERFCARGKRSLLFSDTFARLEKLKMRRSNAGNKPGVRLRDVA